MEKKRRKFAILMIAMKITFLQICLLLIFTGVLYAKGVNGQSIMDKKLTLTVNNTSLKSVIKSIENQLNIKCGFSGNAIKADQKLKFSVKNKLLKNFLEEQFIETYSN